MSARQGSPVVIDRTPVFYHFAVDMTSNWECEDGDRLEVRCVDGLAGRIQTEDDVLDAVDPDRINDASGPIRVRGAHPGDVLAFAIEDIAIDSDQGCTLLLPDFGLQSSMVERPETRISTIDNGMVRALGRFDIPIRPMLGTIGVAPATGSWSTVYPADHGGNMDTADICAGNTVYFPVNVDGAMLGMGDAKAVMGDGEVCSTGVEVPVTVTGTVRVDRSRSIPRPMIETPDEWMTVGSAVEFLDACRLAHGDMVNLLAELQGLSWTDAYALSSLVTSLRISQVVDPQLTVRCAIPKKYLPGLFA